MAHVLNKLSGVKIETIKQQLAKDKNQHAKDGMFLEHLWCDADRPNEIYFLFRVDDLEKHKGLMNRLHKQALEHNPDTVLPNKIFLEEA